VHRAMMWEHGVNWLFLLLRTDTRADSLLVGALLAQLWVRGWRPSARIVIPAAWVATALLAVFVTVARSTHAFLYLGGFTLVAVCTATVILAASEGQWPGTRLLEIPSLRVVGRVSYGLYLWHMPLFYVVNRYGAGWGAPARILVGVPLAAAATFASWRYVEQPFLRLKDSRRRLQAA
jgi:peptidoglycan/LPS O-acetylase OafA/YrhL